ncbi:MAG: class I SAM-dependent methyltransferase [Phycisphaerae bacterium]|nr:class I SAM-dependent methyltransferase [Phycisphaerae bacterium]
MDRTDAVVDVIEGQAFPRSEEVGCPICGERRPSRRVAVRYGQVAMVAECPDCRIEFQTPRPSAEASLAYMNWRWRCSDAYVGNAGSQSRRARRQVCYVEKCAGRPARLVDFGAGAGSFVRAALDRGWDATGIETSDSAIARAREFHRVELHKEFPDERYDVATLWDVIEHLRDLQGTLRTVAEHLVDGGMLFIETGNVEHWLRSVEKDRWPLYLLDHQFYFSPSSLEQVLRRAGYDGFRLLRVNHSYPSLSPKRLVQHPLRAVRSWRAWAQARAKWPAHGDIDLMVAVARKKPS